MGQKLIAVVEDLKKNFLNLVYPLCCIVCNAPLEPDNELRICERCMAEIKPNPRPWCRKCGRSVDLADVLCSECRKTRYHFKRNRSPYLYEGVIKKCIHKFKYSGRSSLSLLLSKLATDFIKKSPEVLEGIDAVVPVPLSKGKLRERGYNQSEMLAKSISKEFDLPLLDALAKARATAAQSELGKEARANNLKGVFRARLQGAIKGKGLLIVDDVFTTGSTVNECSSVLRDAGAGAVYSLTLARGA